MKKTFIAASLMAMAFLSTQVMAAEEMKKDTPAAEETHAQHKSCCPMMQKKMEEMKHDHAMPADGMKQHDHGNMMQQPGKTMQQSESAGHDAHKH